MEIFSKWFGWHMPYDPFEFNNLASLYRGLSFVGTSVVYLCHSEGYLLGLKLLVVIILGIASWWIIILYNQNIENKQVLKNLVAIEYIGVGILLIPTGGIESPFIWYILNSMLNSFRYYSTLPSITLIVGYYFTANYITYSFFPTFNTHYKTLLIDNNIYLLSFLLVGCLIKVLVIYFNRIGLLRIDLEERNNDLVTSKEMMNETLEEMMMFEYIAENMLSDIEFDSLIEESLTTIVQSTRALCGKYKSDNKERQEIQVLCKNSMGCNECHVESYEVLRQHVSFNAHPSAELILVLPKGVRTDMKELCQVKLQFLSRLFVLHYDRIQYYSKVERQEITQEKNRIADELHDTVSQRLFNLSCGLYALKQDYESGSNKIQERYQSLVKALGDTVSDLRESIYQMSTKKQGINGLVDWLEDYLEAIKKIHDINITLRFEGNEEIVTQDQRKVIYRICSEAIGNSIKHGHSKNIWVGVYTNEQVVKLEIIDDGNGFDLESVQEVNGYIGIGLKNIDSLARIVDGTASIVSQIGLGTEVFINMPLNGRIL